MEVSSRMNSPEKKWSRKDSTLDDGSPQNIKINLWNEKGDIGLSVGKKMKVKNVTVDIFKNQVTMYSTDEIAVESVGICKQTRIKQTP